nr:nuclear transport factor 2 family protein [Rhizobium leguminosarum]
MERGHVGVSAAALEALEEAERAFNAAVVSNDPAQIAACITQDWVLVTPERGPIPAQAILSAIGSGVLSHDTMTKTTHHVHLLGNVATVAGRTRACSPLIDERSWRAGFPRYLCSR